jgi:4-amino-4-deoxy-L-arabinose transferase-like glycosyltransferase
VWKRYVYGLIALLLAAAFFYTAMCYWVPAHGGTDQNGYLVGGKMIAQTLTMRQSPQRPGSNAVFDPHQFIGRMWVGADLGTADERYYPKYPIGLPALYAVLIWIGGCISPYWQVALPYCLSPIAMSLSVWGTYLLARRFAGSFGGLLAAMVYATSPVTLQLAINPNSHAACVCCVAWGMYFLIGWWQFRSMPRAIAAGLLLGYAATIRYTEVTLALPLGLVVLFALRWRDWKTLGQAVALLAAWAVPVALLVLYNRFAIGNTTGYDHTNESSGFAWSYAADNWETMLRQMNTYGLAGVFPLALAGLGWMFWWNWRAALVLTAWIVPCLLIYTFYYWAPDGWSIGYLRFFTTILPALALCFFWLMSRLNRWAMLHHETDRLTALSIAIAIVVGIAATIIVAYALQHATSDDHEAIIDPPVLPHLQLIADQWGALAAGAAFALIALALARGRVVVPAVAAGLFSGVVVALQLTNAIPTMAADQFSRYQIQLRADAIRAVVPDGAVIISPDPDLLDHLQFVGNYLLYEGTTFRRDWIQALPNADPPDQPQGLDPGRRDALYNRLKDFSQPQLDEQARSLMRDALESKRRVFFVLQGRPPQPVARKALRMMGLIGRQKVPNLNDIVARLCTPDRFSTAIVAVWPGYSPTTPPALRQLKPRGLRPIVPPDVLVARPPLQIIEVTLPGAS